jgi:uncharacterized protein (TIGR02118 family)
MSSVSYLVRYRGLGGHHDEFCRYYREHHAPLLRAFPGVRGLVIRTPVAWSDPHPVSDDATDFLAEMQFASVEDLDRALRSEERRRARADFAHLPRGNAAVTHQAMLAERLY